MQLYDTLILLPGEDYASRPRSRHAAERYRAGNIGSILISGGFWGFDRLPLGMPETVKIREFLMEQRIPERNIHTDERSLETMGNFTFIEADPLPGNPQPSQLSKFLIVTEQGHLGRALSYAGKVWPAGKYDHGSCSGTYRPGAFAAIYGRAMLHALRSVREPDAQRVHRFLLNEHPFYQHGWFEKPVAQRKLEMALHGALWLSGRARA